MQAHCGFQPRNRYQGSDTQDRTRPTSSCATWCRSGNQSTLLWSDAIDANQDPVAFGLVKLHHVEVFPPPPNSHPPVAARDGRVAVVADPAGRACGLLLHVDAADGCGCGGASPLWGTRRRGGPRGLRSALQPGRQQSGNASCAAVGSRASTRRVRDHCRSTPDRPRRFRTSACASDRRLA